MKISILMLTHNAPKYVYKSIKSLALTEDICYELIVVDNASKLCTKLMLKYLKQKGYIKKLHFSNINTLFAKGNNIASQYCSSDSTHILLLNSDILIKDPEWLKKLSEIHPVDGGISSLGVVLNEPVRADGYCFLIDKDLYKKYLLDEEFEWFWSVTKIQSQILQENKLIIAVEDHEKLLHHFGGRSGKGFKDAKGMGIQTEEVVKWFANKKIQIVKNLE